MKALMLSFILLTATALNAQMKIEVRMVPAAKAVLCEPRSVQIAWQNTSPKDIKIGTRRNPVDSPAVTLIVDGRAIPFPLYPQPDSLWIDEPPTTLKPGEKQEGAISIWEFGLKPGIHTFQAVADFGKFPEDFFHGRAKSNSITIEVSQPAGNDAAAKLNPKNERNYPEEPEVK